MGRTSSMPRGWRTALFRQADLDAALEGLGGCRHFFAEGVRGRIRAFQLRFEAAWCHFDRSEDLARGTPDSSPVLLRRFLIEIYRLECAISQAPVDGAVRLPRRAPALVPPPILDRYPEVRYVVDLRRTCEARLLLHLGRCREAARAYRGLVAARPRASAQRLAGWYSDLAACQLGLEKERAARRNLENAELAVAATGGVFHAARRAATLAALWEFLGNRRKRDEWLRFTDRLDCPPSTRELLERRAARLCERCRELGRAVTF